MGNVLAALNLVNPSLLPGKRTKRPSGLLKDATWTSAGTAYDRDPCPHSVARWDTIADLERPDDLTRLRTRRTDWRCVRPAAHTRETKQVQVPDVESGDPHRFKTITVPDEDARQHADDAGNTW